MPEFLFNSYRCLIFPKNHGNGNGYNLVFDLFFFSPSLLVETGGHNFRERVMKWEEIGYQGGHVGTEKIKSQFGNIHMYILDGGLN